MAPLGPSGPTNFDSPLRFTPTLGGPDPLGAFAPHPNGQKGSKKAQKDPKWLKMTKNGPQKGSRRHLGPRDPPILTPRPILPQLYFTPTIFYPDSAPNFEPAPLWASLDRSGGGIPVDPRVPADQQELSFTLFKVTKNGPKRGSRRHFGPRDLKLV